jgi:glyoxylase-like metal-dependent hydrolase (beta-lactamase superfamily II)
MKKATLSTAFILAFAYGNSFFAATPRFSKLSDHCYYLQSKEGGENVAAVVTDEGVLIIDPPDEPDLKAAIDALKRLTSKAVRWVVFTDYSFSRTAGARYFAEQGATLLASTQLRALLPPVPTGDSQEPAAAKADPNATGLNEMQSFPWFIFSRQMHLFPAGLEIRIFAIKNKARTSGDVVVFVPAEKVLFVGSFHEAARYPDIDITAQGSALGWIDGMKQVIESIPLLKPAIVQAKPEAKQEQEKTLEEKILVVSARGELSNLQHMKDLRDASQKLRGELSKTLKAGRTPESFLASPDSNIFRSYDNLDSFVARLFEDLQKQ